MIGGTAYRFERLTAVPDERAGDRPPLELVEADAEAE